MGFDLEAWDPILRPLTGDAGTRGALAPTGDLWMSRCPWPDVAVAGWDT